MSDISETTPPLPTMWPYIFVDQVIITYEKYLGECELLDRPVNLMDPPRVVAIFPFDWNAVEESWELGGLEPTLSRYGVRVQNYVTHADRSEGRRMLTVDATIARAVLFRDTTLPLRLAQLSTSLLGVTERFKRFGVRSQQFMNNQLRGNFVYLAQMDLWVETERVQTNG